MASWSLSWPGAVCFHLGWQLGPESAGQSTRATQENMGQNVFEQQGSAERAVAGGWGWDSCLLRRLLFPMCVCLSCALWSLKCRFWNNNRMRPSHKMSQIIWLSPMVAAEICYCSSRRGNSSPSMQLSHPWMHWLYNPPTPQQSPTWFPDIYLS